MRERILIYRLGSLGDTIVALPCFNQIKRTFPTAELSLLTNRPVSSKAAAIEVILGTHFFSDAIDYPLGTRNPFKLLRLLWKIRNGRFSKLVFLLAARSPRSVKRDLLFFKLAGIQSVIGAPSDEADFHVRQLSGGLYENETVRLANRLTAIGPIDIEDNALWDLRFTSEEVSARASYMNDFDSRFPVLAVSVGTKMQSKDWGEANWQELLSRLTLKLPHWNLLMFGAADEASVSARCASHWAGKVVNLCGKTSPRVGAAVLANCALFVGHDSGPMHMAACVGIPCVAIFSARNLPGHWYPRGRNNRVIYHQTDCFGCQLEVCVEQKKKCILSITVDEVAAAVLDLLASQPERR